MKKEIYQWLDEKIKLEENHQVVSLPSWRASVGGRRLMLASAIVGEKLAKELAAKREYILEDSLAQEIQLQGVKIDDGKIPHLSPVLWGKSLEAAKKAKPYLEQEFEWTRKGWTLKAIELSPEEKKQLFAVLGNASVRSPWDLLEVVDHLFFAHKPILNLIVATRPRV